MSFIAELKRRNVVRVGIAYVVASWLIVQVGDIARESFGAPDWVMKMVLTALITGLPIVLFFSWAYELTPEGIKKEADVDRSQSTTTGTSKKLDLVTIALVIGAIVLVGLDRFVLEPPEQGVVTPSAAEQTAEAQQDAANAASQNSIAVLPFVNMSNDPDQEYFSDGISEELLNLLVKVEGLTVASRTSSFAYKGSTTNIPQIASELKVGNVLEGSVRKSGDRVRITAQLIDTNNDRHLWSDSYDRELNDIFQVQDEIASAIVAALKAELGLELDEASISVTADTGNMNAYDLYLKGRELTLARRNLPEAAIYLEQAVELDPDFARAWSMLGTASYLVPSWNVLLPEGKAAYLSRANVAIDRALELDPNQSLSWAMKGMMVQMAASGPDYAESLALMDRAIEIDPANATAWLWRAIRYAELGYQEQAQANLERCLEIDPAYQNCRRHLAIVKWDLGEGSEAIALYTELARSGFTASDSIYVPLFMDMGESLAAFISLAHFNDVYPDFPTEAWIIALEHPEQDHSNAVPMVLSWLQSAENKPIGIQQHMLLSLRGYEHLKIDLSFVNNWLWHPPHQHLRDSPYFQRFIHEMNLPEYWEEHGLPDGCSLQLEDYICKLPLKQTVSTGDGT